MKKTIFSGVGTALITPFKNNEVDYVAMGVNIKRQIASGVEAIIILGTTGEPCTISDASREKIIQFSKSVIAKRAKLIVGCGSNNTSRAIEYYKQAQRLGSDGALVVTPYYNKCSQSGLLKHYSAINDSGSLPIIVYNVPSRTGVDIKMDTMQKLLKLSNVCGIKNSCADVTQMVEIFRLFRDKVAIYCGDDALNHIYMSLGATGIISVASNVVPKLCKKLIDLAKTANYKAMNNLQDKMLPFINALFLEVNPIPVKACLSMLGLCNNELKLPLCPLGDSNRKKLQNELNKVLKLYDSL